jgi:DNA-binding response OmpR family regulator
VGDRDAGLETRAVDMHVVRLRAKLRDPAGGDHPDPIVTVRGLGYVAGPGLTVPDSCG